MQTLFQSAFLQSLGFAIANSLWQTALVWLVYLLVSHIFRLSSAAKYRMAVAAQVTSFVWFAITIQFYYGQYSEVLRNSSSLLPAQNIQSVLAGEHSFTSQLIRYMVKAEQVLPYVSMAYLLLMLVLGIRWVSGYRKTQLIRTQGLQKIPVDWRLFVKRIASQLGIKKDIKLYLSETITTPLTIGFLKPVILIPIASINHLTTAQLEAVLLHELAHIKRYDYLVNILLSAVEISLFFNPFTQLLSKSIRKERENSCDDWVLQFQYQAADYAEALLRIAYLQHTSAFAIATADKPAFSVATADEPGFAMAATGKKNDLLVRVKRMIGEKENHFNYRRQLLALVMVTGMLGCIAWINPTVTAKENKQAVAAVNTSIPVRQKQTIAVEPMAMKVDNPLFNPMFFLSEPLKKEMKKNLDAAKQEMEALVTPGGRHEGLIESIPPMVANALEQASIGMAEGKRNFDKELASMEQAKLNLEKIITDSLSIPLPFRSAIKDEFSKSLQSMKVDIEKAKIETDKFFQLKDKVLFDEEKVKKDIKIAMDEISRIDLDGLVFGSLKLAGMEMEPQAKKQPMKTRKPVANIPAEEKKLLVPPMPETPDNMFREISMPKMEMKELQGLYEVTISPSVIKELVSLADFVKNNPPQNLSPDNEKKFRLKLELIQKMFEKKNKVVKTVAKEEEKEEETIVIRMQ